MNVKQKIVHDIKRLARHGVRYVGATPPPKMPVPKMGAIPAPSANWKVDVINGSNSVTDADFKKCVAALQKQVDRDFAPVWNVGADLTITLGLRTNATLIVLDSTPDASALGYHDISNAGIPIGFVFARTSASDGESWQSTASHELLEMLVDPYVNLAALGAFVGGPAFFAYENCDAVQEDIYRIDGVEVSNFQFPSWFQGLTANQYDFMKVLEAPFTLSAGGYFTYFRTVGNWVDVASNAALPMSSKKPRLSRYYRRRFFTDPDVDRKHHKKEPGPNSPYQSLD